jgi:cytidine deaminase
VKPKDAPKALWRKAIDGRKKSHSPYSQFAVGAAVLTRSGKIYSGCNVENASYPGCVCAERVAILKAVSEGQKQFREIVVVAETADGGVVRPCGVCLQTMCEFFSGDTLVWLGDAKGIRECFRFEELLPHRFGAGDLPKPKRLG